MARMELEQEQAERRIRVNGAWATTRAGTVAALLASLRIGPERAGTAVAVNHALVRRRGWSETALHDGDTVDIIHAVQGG